MTRLRQERFRRGWSLQKLGEKTGMQGSDISKVETMPGGALPLAAPAFG